MTDPKRQSDEQERGDAEVERRPRREDPTAVDTTRTSDASTITNGGLGGGRPAGGARITPERARTEDNTTDPVMPDDSSTLNTKI